MVGETPKTPAASVEQAGMSRRHFLGVSWVGLGWSAFTASSAVGGIASARFMFPNALFEPPMVFKIGSPDLYADGIDERHKRKYGIWVIKQSGLIVALSTTCTHLGCTPNWLAAANKIKCPCHGSGFRGPNGSIDDAGINFEGPAPRPLERYAIRLASDGQILIDKSRKFQFEKGQWQLSDSFLVL